MTTPGYEVFPEGTIPIPQADYSAKVQTNTATTTFTSGRVRRRRLGWGKYQTAKLTWLFSPEEYEFFMGWWEYALSLGTRPFSIMMATGATLGEHLCQFVSDPDSVLSDYFWKVSIDTIIYTKPQMDEYTVLVTMDPTAPEAILSLPDVMAAYYTRSW
jgi:hypothetical protein